MADKKPGTAVARNPLDGLKVILSADSIKEQFQNALKENSGAFIASVIELVASDSGLQECDPRLVVLECLKAASLRLPVNKSLGFYWIIPRKIKQVPTPVGQIGYKGMVQLAMRTGQYRYLNCGPLEEGLVIEVDRLTGRVEITGEPKSTIPQGYFAYMELMNGFSKTVYWTRKAVIDHAKRFSPSFDRPTSTWQTNQEAMCVKTVLNNLLSHFGVLSIEMCNVMESERKLDELPPGEEPPTEQLSEQSAQKVITEKAGESKQEQAPPY